MRRIILLVLLVMAFSVLAALPALADRVVNSEACEGGAHSGGRAPINYTPKGADPTEPPLCVVSPPDGTP